DTLWERILGGTGIDQGNSIVQTNDSFYIAAGLTSSRNHDVTSNRGAYAAWLVRLSNKLLPTSFVQSYAVTPTIAVYPNPSHNSFMLQYCLPDDASMEITDMTGKVIYNILLLKNSKRTIINAELWPPGIYLYQILQNGRVLDKGKLVKE
ncbi:MAG: T9SS type A sorting domain-containing protein, partial [Flavipsychrobacter sp.]